jgi:AGZA family xanthine/uracil permease-like MFS transporter
MFDIRSRGSSVGREVLGGVTTFMSMSYILFIQPAVLSKAGMNPDAVFMATCLASGVASILMGVLANYPLALGPGMGENFFFAFVLCGAMKASSGNTILSWPEALALTAVAGFIFLLFSLVGFRSRILNSIPDALKSGIAAGIGLFIAFIGFQWGNLIVDSPNTLIALAPIHGNYAAGLTLLGLAVTILLSALRVRGAILLGILVTTVASWAAGQIWGLPSVTFRGVVGSPNGISETAGAFVHGFGELWGKLLSRHWVDVVGLCFILFFMDMFDTVGTIVGVGKRAHMIVDGKLPNAERALAADAAGTIIGAALGTSTITCYIESITGVHAGARTGLAAVVAGVCMLLALFFQPLVQMVGGGIRIADAIHYPMIAPALIFVGAMMMRAMRDVDWEDPTEAVPAFLTMVTMTFGYSIAVGIAMGFVSYAFAKLISGQPKKCPLLVYIFAILFIFQYAVLQ